MCYLNLALRGLYCLVLSGLLSCGAPNDKAASPQEPEPATFHQPAPASDRASAIADVVVEERDSLPPQTWKKQAERIFERIRYHDDGLYENYKIEFWDEESKTLSKQIMLMDLDPFAELRQLPNAKDVGDVEFDLTAAGQEKLRQYMQAKGYPQWLLEKEVASAFFGIQSDYHSADKKTIAVVYNLILNGKYGEAITILAEYRVYDEKGLEIGNFSDYRGGFSPVASRDGKWMAVGIEEFDEEADIEDMGNFSVLLYDVETGEPVYQNTESMGGYAFAIHDYIVCEDYYYKPDQGLSYHKTFTLDIRPGGAGVLDDYEIDGVYASTYVRTGSKDIGVIRTNRKRLYFEKDFEVSPLKRIK